MRARQHPFRSAARRLAPTLALALALVGATANRAAAQDGTGDPGRSLGPWRVAGQVGTGVVLTPIGFVGGGLTTRWVARRLGANEQHASDAAYAGAWTTSALATAAGASLVGARGPGKGSYSSALVGTVAGGAASFALVQINKRIAARGGEPRPCRLVCALSGVAIFLLPSIGATVGYDVSR